ncbi:glutamate--tRNA ligase [Candidatus Woesebacteria bacterium RIFCSPHIGHO2_01_FULL_41_10]|uniref:Glutamate--tRNA ligase n=1 Tax=Candidatus Woesebacteria bacterium RIFCSPHIGHO2_01_FULL_41_10 TaxID=1802500 RepID=A0A1F7YS38_9BACT|nr:MAG: glutamate--tRNA ligase [Candidatus Woesebacteria bacterium RIFCSPHIGHO2_01_FULL_41_10]
MKVRTRMAPSPTGEYHVGHIRTLLYNYAFARKNEGKFILRIEDTDQVRLVDGAVERIMEVIRDYGFSWEEGPDIGGPYAPYTQSERLDIYKKYAEELVSRGYAYRCFCSAERLAQMREEQKKRGLPSTKYDRHCLHLSPQEIEEKLKNGESYVIRQKMPDNETIVFKDVVYGEISYNSQDLDDQVLLKSDGFPTYQLGVVVDDHLMEITHVMRGNDWLPSTPKHMLLYKAFGWEPPVHIHLPNLKELGSTKKLSKRFGPVSAREFLEEGYLPEAIINFLMLLGWNSGTKQEIYSLDEFIAVFDPEKITKVDLVSFDRAKLDWMNGQYIQKMDLGELSEKLLPFAPKTAKLEELKEIVPLINTRMKKLSDFSELCGFLFQSPDGGEDLSDDDKKHISKAQEALSNLETWDLDAINTSLMKAVDENSFKTSKFFMSLRLAITGHKITPPLNESLVILGKEETLARLKRST